MLGGCRKKLIAAAEALYRRPPKQSFLDTFGLTADDVNEEVEIWTCHQTAVELFAQMGTQWRTSFGGLLGLDYTVLFALMELRQIPAAEREELLQQVQIMESAALAVIHS